MYGVDDGEAIWFHTEPGQAGSLVRYLDSMRFWSQVEVSDVTADFAMVWEPVTTPARHLSRVTERGRDVFVPRAELRGYVDDESLLAGVWAYEAALRVMAGIGPHPCSRPLAPHDPPSWSGFGRLRHTVL
jgi:tRNA-modifying protein YgfZ